MPRAATVLVGLSENFVHAPYVRSTLRQFAIAFVMMLGTAVTAPASAQSARTAVAIPMAIGTFNPTHEPNHEPARCVAVFNSTVPIRVEPDTRYPARLYAVNDSRAVDDDDAIDADALSPGSGMVIVDSHGNLVTPEQVAPPECCPAPAMWEAALVTRHTATRYTASNGSDTRALCVDAMNPPPSSRSPL